MDAAAFEIYTERLRSSLADAREIIGLVTLGSTADTTFQDEWSDHDFWVITEAGDQEALINDLSWLPDADNIALMVSHGPNRRTVIYHNRHKVEFAVFDCNEAIEGKVERYRILIDRGQIAELMETIHQNTLTQAQVRPDALENLCVLVWSACERYYRGELLSARQYLDGFAVNQLLSLISSANRVADSEDVLDPRRRMEQRSPDLAREVQTSLTKPVPEAALLLLEIAEREIKPIAPSLPWDNVSMVRGWTLELLEK